MAPPDYEERLARTREQRLQHSADGDRPEFDAESVGMFDPVYMRKLFDLDFSMAKDGNPWLKAPVGIARILLPKPN